MAHSRHVFPTSRGQNQQMYRRPERVAQRISRPPNLDDLREAQASIT
jgi:hypothetical protein